MRQPKLYLTLIFTISVCIGHAQLISNKEASKIDDLLKKVSEQHKPNSYIFKNVYTLTMLNSQIVEQDVLIENGVIKEIGTDIVSQDAIEIDGKGKYLMPGLTDMHIHLFDHHPMKNTWMLLLLANGVTTVRDMAGEPGKLVLKDKIKNNEILGPNMYQAGPIINGLANQPTFVAASTPEEGRKLVDEQKESGYDFIKVYDDLNSETYLAIVDEAVKMDIQVIGHVPYVVPLEEALKHQSSIEHLTGYREWRNGAEAHLNVNVDYSQTTSQSQTWNCPTLYNLMMNWGGKSEAEKTLAEFNDYIPDRLSKKWESMLNKNVQEKEKTVAKYGGENRKLFSEIVLSLYQADAKLIAGTDAGNLPLMVPGISLHKELLALNETGIPVYDVLKMTTINAALSMGKEEEFGTIEVGKRADLLLLDSNPLEDINNLKKQEGVMVRGIWLTNNDLEQIKQEIQTAFGK